MSGQMQTDDFTAMMGFKRAFKFEKAAYQEFCACRDPPAAPPAEAEGAATGGGGSPAGNGDASAGSGAATLSARDAATSADAPDAGSALTDTPGGEVPAEPVQRTITEAQHAAVGMARRRPRAPVRNVLPLCGFRGVVHGDPVALPPFRRREGARHGYLCHSRRRADFGGSVRYGAYLHCELYERSPSCRSFAEN